LIFHNTRKVWRDNTRGDYWVLEIATGGLKQIGRGGPEASLMFAKFSPDASRVGYDCAANNIYVERIDDGHVKQLTKDGSETTINGTSDWVYEEELGVRDAFRWSPDGTHIAFWQFDSTGCRQSSRSSTTPTPSIRSSRRSRIRRRARPIPRSGLASSRRMAVT
jgi:dipeptidyl-peptidase-4